MTTSLPPSTQIMQDPDIIATDLDGETVMMSIEQGQYYGLEVIGSFLWEQLAAPRSLEALYRRVLQTFEIDKATCRADVSAFVGDLIEKGVLRCVE